MKYAFLILDCHSGIFNTMLLVTRKIEQSLAAAAFHVVGGDKMSLLFLIFSSLVLLPFQIMKLVFEEGRATLIFTTSTM